MCYNLQVCSLTGPRDHAGHSSQGSCGPAEKSRPQNPRVRLHHSFPTIHILLTSCLLARQVSACASPANSIKYMWSEWPSHGLSSMIGIRYCWSRRLTTLISSPLSFAKHRDAVTCPTWRTARRCRGVRRVPSPCAPSPRWSWVGTTAGGWSSRQVDRLCFKLIVYSTLNLTWWIYFWGSGFIFTSDFYFRFVVYFMQSLTLDGLLFQIMVSYYIESESSYVFALLCFRGLTGDSWRLPRVPPW